MDRLGQLMASHFYEETGRHVKMDTKNPFKIIPKDSVDGVPILMPGGHTPIVYDADSKLSTSWRDKMANINLSDGMKELIQSSAGGLTLNKFTGIPGLAIPGYTKARVANVQHPLTLNMSIIAAHTQEVLHDITHRKALREVMGLIRMPDFQKAVSNTFSFEMWETMTKIVEHIAGHDAEPQTPIGQMARMLRTNAGFALIAYNTSSWVNQTLSLPTAAADVGIHRILKQTGYFVSGAFGIGGYREAKLEAANKSQLYASRDRGLNPIMAEFMNKSQRLRGKDWKRLIGPFGMAIAIDSNVSFCIFNAAYEKGLDMGMGEAKAIEYAEQMLRRNQDLPSLVDQSLLQQSGEIGKMVSMFYSASGALFNRIWEDSQLLRRTDISKVHAWGARGGR